MQLLFALLTLLGYCLVAFFLFVLTLIQSLFWQVKVAAAYFLSIVGVMTLVRESIVLDVLCPVHSKTVEEIVSEYARKSNNFEWRVSHLLVWRKLEQLRSRGLVESEYSLVLIRVGNSFVCFATQRYRLKVSPSHHGAPDSATDTVSLLSQPQTAMFWGFFYARLQCLKKVLCKSNRRKAFRECFFPS